MTNACESQNWGLGWGLVGGLIGGIGTAFILIWLFLRSLQYVLPPADDDDA